MQAQIISKIGLLCLKEAVLEVLCEAKRKDELLGPADISTRAGIPQKLERLANGITGGILFLLKKEEKVCRPKYGKWAITEEEFNRRNTD